MHVYMLQLIWYSMFCLSGISSSNCTVNMQTDYPIEKNVIDTKLKATIQNFFIMAIT